jgi:hypothetical protein
MTNYTIINTSGSTVATISPATTTGSTFPIELIGQGMSLYGEIGQQNLYRLLENFAKATAPSNPVEGQFWYDSTNKVPNYYNGTGWITMATAANTGMVRFRMAVGATDLDFTVGASTVIFTHPGTTARYYPTAVMLIPKHVSGVTTPAGFSLSVSVSEDIMETVLISNPTISKSGLFMIEGLTEVVTSGNSISLTVSAPATATQLVYDVLLFGLVR